MDWYHRGFPKLCDALDDYARVQPSQMALIDGKNQITWSDFRERILARAHHLASLGLGVGDVVALRQADGADVIVNALAVMSLGAVHAPVDHRLPEFKRQQLLAHLSPTWLWDTQETADPTPHVGLRSPMPQGAFLRATSGTTGSAKGVLLTQASIVERAQPAMDALGISTQSRVLWCLPMAYHFVVSICAYVLSGACIVVSKGLRATSLLKAAQQHDVTHAYLSPHHIHVLAQLPAPSSLPSSLTTVVATTAALPKEWSTGFYQRHDLPVRQALGIIEVGLPLVSAGGADEAMGALGRPVAPYRARILDDQFKPLEPNIPGELALQGPGLFSAYTDPLQLQADVLCDGYFRTGDLAQIDDQGAVTLLGRLKDVINVGGFKVFPQEVESVLLANPGVSLCRVSRAADPRTGEQVVAEVVIDAQINEESLAAWCRSRLAPLACPAQYHFVDHLPLTASGKVIRHQ